ncbi:MAG: GNAT family N-acetyltransferase [Armatimonadota bacterium]
MIDIRKAEITDIEHFQRIHELAVRELAKNYYEPEQIDVWAKGSSPEKLAAAIEAGKAFIAEYDGKPAGYAMIDLASGWVLAVYVAPEYAGRGVGTALCSYVEKLAVGHGLKSLYLDASLNAFHFYTGIGYVEVERKAFQIAKDIKMDSVNMKKSIG